MRRTLRSRRERGAAAVEFALVAPVLFLLLFGIMDYGLYFADALSVRQAAGQGARLAAPRTALAPDWGNNNTCGTWTPFDPTVGANIQQLRSLACGISQSTSALSGQVFVKIRIVDGSTLANLAPNEALVSGFGNWKVGNTVRVCVIQKHKSVTGLVPLPGGDISSRADMPIQDSNLNSTNLSGGFQPLPNGETWPSWC